MGTSSRTLEVSCSRRRSTGLRRSAGACHSPWLERGARKRAALPSAARSLGSPLRSTRQGYAVARPRPERDRVTSQHRELTARPGRIRSLAGDGPPLQVEQGLLPVQAAAVTGERAVRPDDPVTGDDDRHRIAAVGGADGPCALIWLDVGAI